GGGQTSSGPGASTAGICFGDGSGNLIARGLLPDGQGIVADYDFINMTGPDRYVMAGAMIEEPYNAVFQTASVGSQRTTQYTTISADTDATLFDFDLAHCQSQSNAGWQNSRPQAWAKNMISGGGINHYGTISRADDCWCGGASIGPASDGRIKPTLTHFYDRTYTVDCCGYE
ncbi:MAG: peptidase S8, partial [bacterium]|nr:peptidase S8 [bacterium]